MPLLSIVTINRNDAPGLAVTGASIAALHFRDFEWLVIDGDSSDDSAEVARRYAPDRLVIEADQGRYDAMNKGITLARGEFIVFMNAGDAFHDPACLDFLRQRPSDASLIHANAMFEADGRRFSFISRIDSIWSFVRQNPFCHQSLFYRRAELLQLGGYDLTYRVSADFDLTYRYVKACGQCRRPEFVAVFRVGGFGRQNQFHSLRERLRSLRRNGPTMVFATALLCAPYVLTKFLLLALLEPTGGLAVYRALRTRLRARHGADLPSESRASIPVLGIPIAPARVPESGVVSFVNPFSAMKVAQSALSDVDLERIIFYSDGIALCRLVGWFNRRPIERLSFDFTSLAGEILGEADRRRQRLAVVGATPDANRRFAEFLTAAFPNIECVFRRHGYFASADEQLLVARELAAASPDVILVGLGAGLQEGFGLQLVAAGATGVIYTCGGFLDQTAEAGRNYYPAWADRWNLRWLYRIVREPRRLLLRYLLEYPRFVWYYLRFGGARP